MWSLPRHPLNIRNTYLFEYKITKNRFDVPDYQTPYSQWMNFLCLYKFLQGPTQCLFPRHIILLLMSLQQNNKQHRYMISKPLLFTCHVFILYKKSLKYCNILTIVDKMIGNQIWLNRVFGLWCLTPLSTIFQL